MSKSYLKLSMFKFLSLDFFLLFFQKRDQTLVCIILCIMKVKTQPYGNSLIQFSNTIGQIKDSWNKLKLRLVKHWIQLPSSTFQVPWLQNHLYPQSSSFLSQQCKRTRTPALFFAQVVLDIVAKGTKLLTMSWCGSQGLDNTFCPDAYPFCSCKGQQQHQTLYLCCSTHLSTQGIKRRSSVHADVLHINTRFQGQILLIKPLITT